MRGERVSNGKIKRSVGVEKDALNFTEIKKKNIYLKLALTNIYS